MDIYKKIYEFAASAGAFEGYVYSKEKIDYSAISNWVINLVDDYHSIPPEIRDSFQASCDRTLGRAIRSLIPVLGGDHEAIRILKTLVKGDLPKSPNDFEQEKESKLKR